MNTFNTPNLTPAINRIKELAETFGSLYPDYSGRSMYSAKCVGIVTAEAAALKHAALHSGIPELEHYCSDSMGRDTIIYWPAVQMPKEPEAKAQPTDAEKAQQYLTSYLRGYGRNDTARLRTLEKRGQWAQHAGAVLNQRAYKLLEALDDLVLQEIEAGTISVCAIAGAVANELDAEALEGARHG